MAMSFLLFGILNGKTSYDIWNFGTQANAFGFTCPILLWQFMEVPLMPSWQNHKQLQLFRNPWTDRHRTFFWLLASQERSKEWKSAWVQFTLAHPRDSAWMPMERPLTLQKNWQSVNAMMATWPISIAMEPALNEHWAQTPVRQRKTSQILLCNH